MRGQKEFKSIGKSWGKSHKIMSISIFKGFPDGFSDGFSDFPMVWWHPEEGTCQARGSSVAAWRLTRSDAALGGPAVLTTSEICQGLRVMACFFLVLMGESMGYWYILPTNTKTFFFYSSPNSVATLRGFLRKVLRPHCWGLLIQWDIIGIW